MKKFWVSFYYLFPAIILVLFTPTSIAQLTPSENRIIFQVQKLLQYPQVLQGWTNWTNFCFLPPSPSLKIVCSNGHVTELTIVGNKSSPSSHSPITASLNSIQTLSASFSIDSLFTVMTKLSNLKVLSLVSLGLWGPLPAKINRFWSMEVLNISSNFIHGEIPSSISSMKNLRSLVLADNLFNGSVPDLTRLTSLEELNLGGNKLGPEFPSVENNLVSIILRKNSLRYQIPPQLMHFDKLQIFDISSNEMFGNIPTSLFSLPSLQYLNLATNHLRGNLSVNIACSSALTYVDISSNLLQGKLPSCLGSLSSKAKVLYSGNCLSTTRKLNDQQHPSSYCKKEAALAVKPPQAKMAKKESGMELGLVLGIIGGVVGIAALLALLIAFILRKSKAERLDHKIHRSVADKFSARASSRPNIDARRVPQTMRLAAVGLPPYCIFTSEEIEDATNNFDPSNLIGEGSQGQLYKGWLRDGSVVLVNCIKIKQKGLPRSIMQHLEVLPNLRHRHIVSVLGHCVITHQDPPQTTSTVFVVFEHVSNVSLRDQLTDGRKREMLKWPQRMAISIGIARGIHFLHTGVAPAIFGNNLKIENILLDDSLNAKVSKYSIPLPSKVRTHYPICSTNNAEKEDIYQLGVILLEIITGKQITSSSEVEELKDELEKGSSEAASILRSAIDPSLRGTYAYESMKTAVQITMNCLYKVSSNRPSIEDVLWNLQYSMQVQESWTSSGNLSTKL
ncbi:probable LRR receptor-like serine/threonine-protein kinase At1g14390 isoform X2 [Gastrolobium bilobum]|uniref:probable LRR receptor-like serine/threonine-protein kinase At1g14390 isoform X2 n=1 Tax=Gastrolobium bilobum TaxID=150636 RepID=UPI002AB0ECA2|nr:probable LRR receptor-like serine/threonine-protein kinase At1g14390 isoform X2 [Gastrolobium bilobum]